MVSNAIQKAQKRVEARNFDIRKYVLEYDDVCLLYTSFGKEIIMPETKNLIEIKHISKKFGDLTVLKDISLKVKEKEVVVCLLYTSNGKVLTMIILL